MKKGYKHKTSIFGNSAENYVSRLLMLMKHPNGDRRPDLISIGDRYDPVLSVEVKSGRKNKGVLVDYQLHYAITTEQSYIELFGEKPKPRSFDSELFGKIDGQTNNRLLPGDPIAYYYCVIDREDELTSEEMDRSYSSIKCRWGNLSFVPPEFAFYTFAIVKSINTGKNLSEVIYDLKEMVKEDSLSWKSSNYKLRKNKGSWQDLQGRDIRAIFEDDVNIATPKGKDRIKMLHEVYPELRTLKRVLIDGPNSTKLYSLVKPEDYKLFDTQIRKTVNERIEIIERITRARKRATPLLNKVPEFQDELFFLDDRVISSKKSKNQLKPSETLKLERLVNWLDKGEKKLTRDPF